MHDFTGVAFVGLQQEWLRMAATARSGAVIKNTFAAVVQQVVLIITG